MVSIILFVLVPLWSDLTRAGYIRRTFKFTGGLGSLHKGQGSKILPKIQSNSSAVLKENHSSRLCLDPQLTIQSIATMHVAVPAKYSFTFFAFIQFHWLELAIDPKVINILFTIGTPITFVGSVSVRRSKPPVYAGRALTYHQFIISLFFIAAAAAYSLIENRRDERRGHA